MNATFVRIQIAVALFAVVHSALASREAKQLAARLFGETWRNRFYRPAYLIQSAATFAALFLYLRQLPGETVYELDGLARLAAHAGQAAGIVAALFAAWQIGMLRVTGLANLRDGREPEPEAQGPALDSPGRARAAGPFAWSRHPLNFAPLPILWLWPVMDSRMLAFNVAATVYLVLGSYHEERRLRLAYGEAYRRYQQSGVPFFVPLPLRDPRRTIDELTASLPPGRAPAADPA